MIFYFKLTKELKKQFKTFNILILGARAKCVAMAQRIQEGLYRPNKKQGIRGLDQKDQYFLDYRPKEDRNQNQPRTNLTTRKPKKELIYYQYNKLGHYATSCPNRKEPSNKAKVQLAQQRYSSSTINSRASTTLLQA